MSSPPPSFRCVEAGRSHPRHYQNRFIIMGDWNIRAHECGEHYWMVRKLREHFGYAVDVSMAVTGPFGDLRQSMHTKNLGYGQDEVPLGYQHQEDADPRSPPAWVGWAASPDFTSNSSFPWWATDWRGKTSSAREAGERLSMIVLVGNGWAYDDAVLSYSVMSDSNFPSPMSPRGEGVEMFRVADCADLGSVANDARGYAPTYSLGCDTSPGGGTRRGAPALHSDHRPMGVRLRVWSR